MVCLVSLRLCAFALKLQVHDRPAARKTTLGLCRTVGSARASCAVSSARLETQGARDVPGGASSTTAAGGWAPERDFWRNDSIKESATTTRESCGLGFWHRVESYKIIGACFEV